MNTENITLHEPTGGWLNVQIASIEEITYCPQLLTNENASSIVITGEHETIDVLPIPERFTVSVNPRKSKNGTTYNINISFDFPLQSSLIDDYFNKYKNKFVVALCTDTNGKVKIFGSKNHPLEFSYQEIQGKKLEDTSMTRITVEGTIGQKPVYLQ